MQEPDRKIHNGSVKDNILRSDPCTLEHNCVPIERHEDKAKREKKEKGLQKFSAGGYEKKRKEFSREASPRSEKSPWNMCQMIFSSCRVELQNRKQDEQDLHIHHAHLADPAQIAHPAHPAQNGLLTLDTFVQFVHRAAQKQRCRSCMRSPGTRTWLRSYTRAAKEAFPGAHVEGCAFHLAPIWNSKANELNVRNFIKEPM
ncbi:hypothetical protein RB195_003523 [Necator americanus]|uniref:Uncharacterized protein n=1 Tax=Necator americanus TaxID=51031 RepID=A0ABR1DNZ5_NECAM